jgi:AcrR family transcriptional regulator
MPRPAIREDGRHARKARTREAIVSALLSLLDEGVPEPTAAQIAERAKVAVRSIAQHFRTREQLMLAIASQHVARQPDAAKKVAADAPFTARLEDFLKVRVQELESSRAIRRAASAPPTTRKPSLRRWPTSPGAAAPRWRRCWAKSSPAARPG